MFIETEMYVCRKWSRSWHTGGFGFHTEIVIDLVNFWSPAESGLSISGPGLGDVTDFRTRGGGISARGGGGGFLRDCSRFTGISQRVCANYPCLGVNLRFAQDSVVNTSVLFGSGGSTVG